MEMLVDDLDAAPARLPAAAAAGAAERRLDPGRAARTASRCPGPPPRVVSLGGATEASIWSIFYPIDEVEPGLDEHPLRPAAGEPDASTSSTRRCEPRPVWVPGELYIGGVGLAQGYWRDEEQTAASFVTHPRTGERLYRTGDLGRCCPTATIEFLGREDYQVKIQGYRIELGEIEAALTRTPGISQAVVTAVGERCEAKRLVAYVVPEDPAPVPGGRRAHGRAGRGPPGRAARLHGAPGLRGPGRPAGHRQRQGGPQGAPGARRPPGRPPGARGAPDGGGGRGGRGLGRRPGPAPGGRPRQLLRGRRRLPLGHPPGVPASRPAGGRACRSGGSSTRRPWRGWRRWSSTSGGRADLRPTMVRCATKVESKETGSRI